MKSFPFLGLSLAVVLFATGCARYYRITTNSGRVITAQGKPHYDKANSVFVFKDMRGVQQRIPAGSVSQIAPASDTSSPTAFNPKPAR